MKTKTSGATLLSKITGFIALSFTAHAQFIYTTINYPAAVATDANGVSGNDILGDYSDGSNGHGFFYDGSTWTTLDDPLAVYGTVAQGISGGNIVGYYNDNLDHHHGFLYWQQLHYAG